MDLKTFASNMWPYWMLGVMVMATVIAAGQKHLIRVEKKPLLKWIAFLGAITLWRFFISKIVDLHSVGEGAKQVTMLPWPIAFTVFWEDLCHGLPLLILRKLIGVNKWTRPIHLILTGIVMVEFGLGHMYQGPLAAVLLSFYIPYSVRKGEEHGFGTIMIGHMLYDLVTLLFVRYLIGA